MTLDHGKYRIVWNSPRGHGHLFSFEANNIVCSRGGRKLGDYSVELWQRNPRHSAHADTLPAALASVILKLIAAESNATTQPESRKTEGRNGETK